jgi:hypothetical protein
MRLDIRKQFHPPPMKGQAQRLGGAARSAPDTAVKHGWTEKEATAYEWHRIRQRLATGARREFHENETAHICPPSLVSPSAASATRGRSLRYGTPKTEPVRSVTSRT